MAAKSSWGVTETPVARDITQEVTEYRDPSGQGYHPGVHRVQRSQWPGKSPKGSQSTETQVAREINPFGKWNFSCCQVLKIVVKKFDINPGPDQIFKTS